MGENIHTVT